MESGKLVKEKGLLHAMVTCNCEFKLWECVHYTILIVVNFNFRRRLMISQKIKKDSIIKAMKYARISQCMLLIINNTFTKVAYPYCTSETFNIHNHLPYMPTIGITFLEEYSKISFMEPL